MWFSKSSKKCIKTKCEQIVRRFIRELKRRQGVSIRQAWFQQDGATPHTSNFALTFLREVFGYRIISRRAEHEWAPHSPDLNPLDFFLWGYLKDRVYGNSPQTLDELKLSVETHTNRISLQMCRNVIANFNRRIAVCLKRKGAHFEHVI